MDNYNLFFIIFQHLTLKNIILTMIIFEKVSIFILVDKLSIYIFNFIIIFNFKHLILY
jgi:hypothetical protein